MIYKNILIFLTIISLYGCGSGGDSVKIGAKTSTDKSSIASMEKILDYASGKSLIKPTVSDYNDANFTFVHDENINAINDAIVHSDAESYSELEELVDEGLVIAKESLDKINNYSSNHDKIPTCQDYQNIGTGDMNLNEYTLVTSNLIKKDLDLTGKDIQNIANSSKIILRYSVNNLEKTPNLDNYNILGLTLVSNTNLDDINKRVGNSVPNDINTFQKLQDLINLQITHDDAIVKISEYADTQHESPTLADFKDGELDNVFESNLSLILEAISNKNKEECDTQEKIQAIIDATIPNPLPEGITINTSEFIYNIASIVNTQEGKIVNEIPITINYTIDQVGIDIPAFVGQSITLDSSLTKNNEENIKINFKWSEQTSLTSTTGTFIGYITMDDTKGDNDNTCNLKQLAASGPDQIIGKLIYPTDDIGNIGNIQVKIVTGVLDKNFNQADNSGNKTHNFIYKTIISTSTGRTWLNNNLGAAYASMDKADDYGTNCNFDPSANAKALDDHCAFGSYFQWGRKADGHELSKQTATTTTSYYTETATAKEDEPLDSKFIVSDNDWRNTSDNTLWNDEGSANNPCPAGFRIPTIEEWDAEIATWSENLGGDLKLTYSGRRAYNNGWETTRTKGIFWSSSTTNNSVRKLFFDSNNLNTSLNTDKTNALPVRCIKN